MTAGAQAHGRLSLHIGAQQTVVFIYDAVLDHATGEPHPYLVLELGFEQIANLHFKRDIPTPLELECAIETVEDQVVRARSFVAPNTWLASSDANLHEVATAAHGHSAFPTVITLAEVKHMFNRLAAVSLGRPASSEGLPPSKLFAATLLILREFMHHLQCPGLHMS
jgi:exopolyphosphatase/pppGpp-phosphohydrolase